MNFAFGISGQLDIEILKNSFKKIFFETPVLQTRIKKCLFFIKRSHKSSYQKNEINQLFIVKKLNESTYTTPEIKQLHNELISIINSYIDTSKEPPIKLFVCSINENKNIILLKVNHTLCDAHGSYILFSKIMQAYNGYKKTPNKITISDEPKNYSINGLKKYKTLPNIAEEESENILFHRDNNSAKGTLKSIPYYVTDDDYTLIKKCLKRADCSINDLIITSVALTYYSLFNEEKSKDLKFESLYDFRKNLRISGGISNFVALFNIIIKPEDLQNKSEMLKVVHKKYTSIIERNIPLRNAAKALIMKYFPIQLVRHQFKKFEENILKNNHPHVTTSITNTGKLDEIIESPSECTIEYTWATTQTSPTYGMKWGAATINNRLTFNLAYLNPVITDKTATSLMKTFKKELLRIVTNET